MTATNKHGALFYLCVVPAGFTYAAGTTLMKGVKHGAFAIGRGFKEIGSNTFSGCKEVNKLAHQTFRIAQDLSFIGSDFSSQVAGQIFSHGINGAKEGIKGVYKSSEVAKVILGAPFKITVDTGKEVADITASGFIQFFKGAVIEPYYFTRATGEIVVEVNVELIREIAACFPPGYYESKKLGFIIGAIIWELLNRKFLQDGLIETMQCTISAGKETKKIAFNFAAVSKELLLTIQSASISIIAEMGDGGASSAKQGLKGLFVSGRIAQVIGEPILNSAADGLKELYEDLFLGAILNAIASGKVSVSVLRTGWDTIDMPLVNLTIDLADYFRSFFVEEAIKCPREIYFAAATLFALPQEVALELFKENWELCRALASEFLKEYQLMSREAKGAKDVLIDGQILYYQQKAQFVEWLRNWRKQKP